MKLIYTDAWGRKHVRQFRDWAELCEFIIDFYPIFQVAGAFGMIRLQR